MHGKKTTSVHYTHEIYGSFLICTVGTYIHCFHRGKNLSLSQKRKMRISSDAASFPNKQTGRKNLGSFIKSRRIDEIPSKLSANRGAIK